MRIRDLVAQVWDHEAQGLGYMVLRKPRNPKTRYGEKAQLIRGLNGRVLAADRNYVTIGLEVDDVRAWLTRRGLMEA